MVLGAAAAARVGWEAWAETRAEMEATVVAAMAAAVRAARMAGTHRRSIQRSRRLGCPTSER